MATKTKTYEIRYTVTSLLVVDIEASSEEEARQMVLKSGAVRDEGQNIDTIDWDVRSVKESK